MDPNCQDKGCVHLPSFVIACGYDLKTALDSVGKGWHKLVRDVFAKMPEGIKVVQVKEKFGGLRIYYQLKDHTQIRVIAGNEDWEKMHKLVRDAEEKSFQTCENCGAPGSRTTDRRWIRTLCADCKISEGRM